MIFLNGGIRILINLLMISIGTRKILSFTFFKEVLEGRIHFMYANHYLKFYLFVDAVAQPEAGSYDFSAVLQEDERKATSIA